jgi:hypothetical protein
MPEAFKFPDEQEEDKQVSAGEASADSGAQEELEVEIVDDTPEKDRFSKPLEKEVEDPTEDEIDSYSDKVQKRIKELTHARHDERRAKESLAREKAELERVTRAMLEENKRLRQYVNSGSEQYAQSIQQVANAEVDAAKRKLKEASEAFDTDAIVEAQEALMEAKMKLAQAKNFRPPALQEPEVDVQTQQQPVKQEAIDDKTLRWQAKNQWFGSPGYEEMTAFALGLHQKLVNSGVDPRSDDYFERVDARMKSTFRDFFGETQDKPKSGEGTKKPATVVAPASRSSGARKVQLTSTQVALAAKFGLTPQQYAIELAKLENSNG